MLLVLTGGNISGLQLPYNILEINYNEKLLIPEYRVLKIIQTRYCLYGVITSCKKKIKFTSFSSVSRLGRSIRGFRRLNSHDLFFNHLNLKYRVHFYAFIPAKERRNKWDILVLVEGLLNNMMEFYYTLERSQSWHHLSGSKIKAVFKSLLYGPPNVKLNFILFSDKELKYLDNLIKKYSKF